MAIRLRGEIEVADPLRVALEFVTAYPDKGSASSAGPASFDEADLRRANQGGARIAATEAASILGRRSRIERALREIHPDASLADATEAVPWSALTRLFDAFADIRGVGFSKMTKALHPKRPALIPMLDSVVQAYLTSEPAVPRAGSFGEDATALVRSYKRDLDRNNTALREVQRELESRGHRLTEVRVLDILIWSVGVAGTS
jgi:Family of unknown function (DUF6308)